MEERMERKNGRKDRRVGGRRRKDGEKKGKRQDAEWVLPLYFWIFHFYTCSLSISKISLGALRHPAPSSRLVDVPAESCVWTTSNAGLLHWSAPTISGQYKATNPGKSAPGRLHFMAHGWELWRTSGHEPEVPLALHQELQWEAFSSYLCQGITWHAQSTAFLGSPSGNRGSEAPWGGGRGVPLRILIGTQPCLPHSQPPEALPSPLLHLPPPSTPKDPDTQFRVCPQTTQEDCSLNLDKCIALCGNPHKKILGSSRFPKMSPALLFPFPSYRNDTTLWMLMHIFHKKETCHGEYIHWR